MDLDLDNVLEVNEIRKLISHKKNLLEFFDELIKIKNIEVNTQIINTDYELPNDTLYSSDSDYSTEED
tara:strand:+ start:3248 stop:3451 length:204 start_codon:yes stop_codon:yes gene_type:complete